MSTTVVERLLALLALLALAITLAGILVLARGRVSERLRDAALPLAGAVAAVATGGSLYLSEVAGYLPCVLCWYQRIAMYPLVIVVGVAAWRRDWQVWRTAVPIAAVGAAIAIWHVLVERLPDLGSGVCDAAAPCTILWVEKFGFLTIPTMALIGFVTIIVLTLVARLPLETNSTAEDHPIDTPSHADGKDCSHGHRHPQAATQPSCALVLQAAVGAGRPCRAARRGRHRDHDRVRRRVCGDRRGGTRVARSSMTPMPRSPRRMACPAHRSGSPSTATHRSSPECPDGSRCRRSSRWPTRWPGRAEPGGPGQSLRRLAGRDRMATMPELPDIEDYLAALRPRVVGARLERVRITGFSLLKTFDPPVSAVEGAPVSEVRRSGKRIVFAFAGDEQLFAVLHLMIAGRLRWKEPGAKVPGKVGMAAFDFVGGRTGDGTLVLTEAGTKKRASLHLVRGEEALAEHDRGGIDPRTADLDAFTEQLRLENRTLKRALTDPRRFSGIGNAFSDEILHAAQLSPVKRTHQLAPDEVARLRTATQKVLTDWVTRLRARTGDGFPTEVTAFRPEFAVHGKHGRPCPVCDTPVQRIRYADNETNYCPRCQTEGRILADRSLSRLLKDDWPKTVDELEGS